MGLHRGAGDQVLDRDDPDDLAVDAVSYSLTAAARGLPRCCGMRAGTRGVATLFSQQHQPGKQYIKFTATNAPEGHFQLVAHGGEHPGRTVTASVPVVIDRTVTSFSVAPAVTNSAVTFSFDLARVSGVRLDIQLVPARQSLRSTRRRCRRVHRAWAGGLSGRRTAPTPVR